MRKRYKPLKRLLGVQETMSYPCCNQSNASRIEEFIDLIHSNEACFEEVVDPLSAGEDIIVAAYDRYGIPIDTVVSTTTGLMRSNRYYTDAALKELYENYYRDIYSQSFGENPAPKSDLISGQISNGVTILKRVKQKLPESAKILDYGCGIGATLLPFQEAGYRVTGVDYGADYIERGRELNLNLIVGGIEDLPSGEKYDLIILSHVLEHIKSPVSFLEGLKQKLNAGGFLYIEVPGLRWIQGAWHNDLLLHIQNAHVWYFTAETLEVLLNHAGLCCEERYGNISYIASVGITDSLGVCDQHANNVLSYLKMNEMLFKCKNKTIRRCLNKLLECFFVRCKDI